MANKEENKLIGMIDFVLENPQFKFGEYNEYTEKRLGKIVRYADFLKRKLELGMFVATDKEGNMLKKVKLPPIAYEETSIAIRTKYEQYQEAKDKVLFEDIDAVGWKINHWEAFFKHHKNIEGLIPFEYTLTEAALKIIKNG